jgi:hypothetical protein
MFLNSYSLTNMNSCQDISSPDYYNITNNLSIGTICSIITSSNVTINCNNYTVDGISSAAFYINGNFNNISILNCNFNNLVQSAIVVNSDIIPGSNYFRFENISISNSNGGISIDNLDSTNFTNIKIINSSNVNGAMIIQSSKYNNFKNIELINSTSYGLNIYYSQNSLFENILIRGDNLSKGIYFDWISSQNVMDNLTIINTLEGIVFEDSQNNNFTNINLTVLNNSIIFNTGLVHLKNIFKDSYLGNFSKIISSDWNKSNSLFYDNTYLAGTYPLDKCFNVTLSICDIPFPIFSNYQIETTSVLPSQSFFSIILSMILLFIFLI